MKQISHRCPDRSAERNAASRSAVAATNRRETAEELVADASAATAAPTGSSAAS